MPIPGINVLASSAPPFATMPKPTPFNMVFLLPVKNIPAPIGINALTIPGTFGNLSFTNFETKPAATAPATTPNTSFIGNFIFDFFAIVFNFW